MPGAPYSDSFLRIEVHNLAFTYTVPDRHRSVVKAVVLCNGSAAAAAFYVVVHGIQLISRVVQASTTEVLSGLQVVAYEHETIAVFLAAAGCTAFVGGYTLADPEGSPPPDVDSRTAPGVLPAGAVELGGAAA